MSNYWYICFIKAVTKKIPLISQSIFTSATMVVQHFGLRDVELEKEEMLQPVQMILRSDSNQP